MKRLLCWIGIHGFAFERQPIKMGCYPYEFDAVYLHYFCPRCGKALEAPEDPR